MPVKTKQATITCALCKRAYEYEDDAVNGVGSAECLPDGYLVSGIWICDDCGSCPECGASRCDWKPRCEHQLDTKEDAYRWALECGPYERVEELPSDGPCSAGLGKTSLGEECQDCQYYLANTPESGAKPCPFTEGLPYCPKCGCHFITHNDDGSCVED